MTRAGFAADEAPRVTFPCIIGRYKNNATTLHAEDLKLFVGEDVFKNRGILASSYPVVRGSIAKWDDIECLWHHTFYSALRIDPSAHNVLFTESPTATRESRERLVHLMFEVFSTPGIYIQSTANLALFASGRTTGMIVASGAGVSHVVPIYEGYTLPHGVAQLPLGGSDITEYFLKLINERCTKFTTATDRELIRDMKEKLAFVALDFEKEMGAHPRTFPEPSSYRLPDGDSISLERERMRCMESLFKPHFVTGDTAAEGLDRITNRVLLGADEDIRRDLYNNIVLAGGTTLTRGFHQRLAREVVLRAPPSMHVRVVAPPERGMSSWIGGSILASLSSFSNFWATKADYDEIGASVIHRKCF